MSVEQVMGSSVHLKKLAKSRNKKIPQTPIKESGGF